jgi:hypothetical protein
MALAQDVIIAKVSREKNYLINGQNGQDITAKKLQKITVC